MNKLLISVLLIAALLTACGGDDNKKETMTSSSVSTSSSVASSSSLASSMPSQMPVKFSVTITNLTSGQPFSPPALVLHKPDYRAFNIGMPASVGLEKLAEGGDSTAFLAEAAVHKSTYLTAKGTEMVLPGGSATITADLNLYPTDMTMLRLTFLTMPVNTNDAFTGGSGFDLGQMAVGDHMTLDLPAYDAGTERNSESVTSIPGPAAGGEGFNPMRDDSPSVVSMHSGAVTKDDGLTGSALNNLHRWDNPIARVTVTRLEP